MAEGQEIRDVIYRIRVEADPRSKSELNQFTQAATQSQRAVGKVTDESTAKIRQQADAVKKVNAEYEKSMATIRSANGAVVESSKQALGGVTALARGMVLLGVSGEKDLQKALQTLAKFEAAAQVARGLTETVQGLTRVYQAYRTAVQAAAVAQATLTAAQAASAATGPAAAGRGVGTFGQGVGTGAVGTAGIGLSRFTPFALPALATGITAFGVGEAFTGAAANESSLVGQARGFLGNDLLQFISGPLGLIGRASDTRQSNAQVESLRGRSDALRQFQRTTADLDVRQGDLNRQQRDNELQKQRDTAQFRLDSERQILQTMKQEAAEQQQILDAAKGRFQSAARAFALADPLSQQRAVRLKGRFDRGENLTPEELDVISRFSGEAARPGLEAGFVRSAEAAGFGAFQTAERDIIAAGVNVPGLDRQRGAVEAVAGELRELVQQLVRRQDEQTAEMFLRLQDAIREERQAAANRASEAGVLGEARRIQALQAAQGPGDFGGQ